MKKDFLFSASFASPRFKKLFKARRVALCLFVFAGLAFALNPARADDTDSRLDHLENEVQTLSRAVFKGDVPASADSTEAIPGGAAAAASAGTQARLSAMDQSIQDLTSKVEEQGHTIQQLQQQLDQMKAAQAPAPAATNKSPLPDTDNLPDTTPATDAAPPGGKTDGAADASAPGAVKQLGKLDQSPSGAVKASGSDPANQYEDAFAALRNKHYDDAETGFKSFLASYPNSALAPNAQYWLGESYYAANDFSSAARAFAAAYQKYPHSAKAPDALLKLSLSLAGMNKTDDACLALAQLKSQYSAGAAAVLARADQERQTLACK